MKTETHQAPTPAKFTLIQLCAECYAPVKAHACSVACETTHKCKECK